MLKKILRSSVALLLVFVLCLQLAPADVFAAAADERNQQSSGTLQRYVDVFDNSEPTTVGRDIVDDDIVCEVEERRDEFTKHYRLTDSSMIAAVYDIPVHEKDSSGMWVEIDNNLVSSEDENGEEVFAKESGKNQVSFAKKAKADKLLTIKTEYGKIKWGLAETSKELKNGAYSAAKAEKNKEKLTVKSVGGIIQYEDILPGVTLTYQLVGNDIKENIVLSSSAAAQSFEFTLQCSNMTAKLEGNQIVIYSKKGEFVRAIAAPYMIDSNDQICDNVTLSISGKNGKYTVTITPDMEWLKDESRAYPVIIDPTIINTYTHSSVDNTSVNSVSPNSSAMYQYGCVYVGRESSTYGNLRGVVKFTLPTGITESDMIIDAYVKLTQRNYFDSGTIIANMHKITEELPLSSMTWNKLNGKYDSTVLDSMVVSKSTNETHVKWDITAAVKSWYLNGDNYGLALVSENEGSTYKYAIFYTARYPNVAAAKLPATVITYLNHDGIEDYLSYHYAGSDTMGSLAVGDFNGNLIYCYDDISMTGNYLPLNISHVYNHSRRANENLAGGNMYYGKGMRLNVSQRIETAGITGYTYKYTDEDGTIHYFSQSSSNSSVHEKEFDTTTTIKVNSNGTFTLSDSGDISYIFNSSGYLTSIKDASNNKSITLTYTNDKLTKVTDGAGREVTLSYNSDNYLTSITDPAGRSTTYSYTNGYLTEITRPDHEQVYFNYTADGSNYILTSIEDIDGSTISIEYNTASPRRVSRITEYDSTNSIPGNMLTWSYTPGETTITDRSGKSETMMFDNTGHTVCIRDSEGNAVYGSYANTSDNNKNSLSYQSQLQSSVTNYLTNHGFEGSSLSPWANYLVSATGELSQDTTTVYSGNKSAKIHSTSNTGRVGYQGTAVVPGSIGSTITVSAYVKITDITTIDEDYSGLFLGIIYQRADGVWATDASPSYKTTTDWQRMSHTFKIPDDAISETVRMSIAFNCAEGTAYVDNAQLELGAVANRYNMLDNGHFREAVNSATAASWYRGNLSDTTDLIVAGRNGNGIQMVGARTTSKFLEQTVYHNGKAGDCFVFGGWVRANALAKTDKSGGANRDCAIRIYFIDTNGNNVGHAYFNFEAKSPNWQYLSGSVTAPSDYTAVRFAVLYYNQKNTAVFDDLQLYKENFGQRLEYDDYGRLTSATDSMGRTTTYTYAAAKRPEISKITYSDGSTTTYTYDTTTWRLLTVTDPNGKTTTYHYDANGNNTEVSMTANGETISSGVITYDGSYISAVTDSRGNTVTYDYNEQKGTLDSVTDPKGTQTTYSYNANNDYLLGVESSGSEVDYEYSYGKLVSISHNTSANNSVTYNLEYDGFGNSTSVKVGTQALITHQYAPNNGLLTRSTYGNGDYYQPGYDELDRLVSASYNGVEKYNWDYGADGRIGLHTDLVNDVQWRYEYTLGGDLTSVRGSNGERFSYTYDTASGNLIGFTASDGETDKTTTYVYGEQLNNNKNLIDDIVLPTGTINYYYDNLSRQMQCIEVNGNEILSIDYAYEDGIGSENHTTPIINYYDNVGNGWSLYYEYFYDCNGNIQNFYNKNAVADYYYDELNQLIREDNAWLNKTIVYTYDLGGNIQLVEEYPYTKAATVTGTPTASYTYTYGDSNWKDKLTSYNGNTITYDEIGNPLSYYNGLEFEWQNGRQLASVSGSDLAISYKYNADGVRTSKTVNGVTTNYTINGINVIKETNGTDTLWYYYDASGNVISFELNGAAYFYVKNLQGDITAIINANGDIVVEYVYDSWGKLISITGTLADTVGVKNPYRYRGYRYDTELGMYYLQSRYYDPAVKRFINADGFVSTGKGVLGNNMFAYCNNNPLACNDSDGEGPVLIIVATAIILAGAVAGAWFGYKANNAGVKLGSALNKKNEILENQVDGSSLEPSDKLNSTKPAAPPSNKIPELTIKEKRQNVAIGVTLGTLVGSSIVLLGGVLIVLAASGTVLPASMVVSGAQFFAMGTVVFDTIVMFVLPIWGIELEAIEYGEAPTY